MREQIKEFLTYLFDNNPGSTFSFYTEFIVFISILLISGVAFSFYYKKNKKENYALKRQFKNLSKHLIQLSILFAILIVCRYERIPYFSMRFILLLALGIFVFASYKYIKKWRVDYPLEKETQKLNQKKKASKGKKKKKYTTSKKRK